MLWNQWCDGKHLTNVLSPWPNLSYELFNNRLAKFQKKLTVVFCKEGSSVPLLEDVIWKRK